MALRSGRRKKGKETRENKKTREEITEGKRRGRMRRRKEWKDEERKRKQ